MASEIPSPEAGPEVVRPEPAGDPIVRSRYRRLLVLGAKITVVLLGVWLLAAYVILPAFWRHYEHHPALEDAPKTTLTSQGIPGDPLNVGLIGHEADVVASMLAAGWSPADPITLRSSLAIAASVVFKWPDPHAPVSSLFLFGRKQDLAFEKLVGGNARRRHHVRFWKSDALGSVGKPLYIGSATFDVKVGISHYNGEITHHIAADIDTERNGLINDLIDAARLVEIYEVTGVGATLLGRNGGGDRYFTDGELKIGILATGLEAERHPRLLPNPPVVQLKEQLWSAIRPLLMDGLTGE
jgi:hypothetical protein